MDCILVWCDFHMYLFLVHINYSDNFCVNRDVDGLCGIDRGPGSDKTWVKLGESHQIYRCIRAGRFIEPKVEMEIVGRDK